MSLGLNKVSIIGYLGHDPEVRYTQSGIAVANLNIAVSEKRKNGNEWKNHTEWFNVICFGKSAENVGKFLKKGRQLFIEGKLQNRQWEDKNGNKNIITEIIANQILFLGNKESNNDYNSNNKDISDSINKKNITHIDKDIPF